MDIDVPALPVAGMATALAGHQFRDSLFYFPLLESMARPSALSLVSSATVPRHRSAAAPASASVELGPTA
jgi:hypothetical protein